MKLPGRVRFRFSATAITRDAKRPEQAGIEKETNRDPVSGLLHPHPIENFGQGHSRAPRMPRKTVGSRPASSPNSGDSRRCQGYAAEGGGTCGLRSRPGLCGFPGPGQPRPSAPLLMAWRALSVIAAAYSVRRPSRSAASRGGGECADLGATEPMRGSSSPRRDAVCIDVSHHPEAALPGSQAARSDKRAA